MTKNFSEFAIVELLRMTKQSLTVGDSATVLDLFCGNGTSFSHYIRSEYYDYTGFDVDEKKIDSCISNKIVGRFEVQDAFKWIKKKTPDEHGFDIIVIDNPLCIFGSNNEYCEHFGLIGQLSNILNEKACVILDVVPRPYDAFSPENKQWMMRRAEYYNTKTPENIDEYYLADFYINKFKESGFSVNKWKNLCREYKDELDYFHVYYFDLTKTNDSCN